MKGYLKENAFVQLHAAQLVRQSKRSSSRGATAKKLMQSGKNHQTQSSSFKVCVRVRPLLTREKLHNPKYPRHSNSIIQCPSERNVCLVDTDFIYAESGAASTRDKQFTFDHAFSETATNE